MILTDQQILAEIDKGTIIIEPFDRSRLRPTRSQGLHEDRYEEDGAFVYFRENLLVGKNH